MVDPADHPRRHRQRDAVRRVSGTVGDRPPLRRLIIFLCNPFRRYTRQQTHPDDYSLALTQRSGGMSGQGSMGARSSGRTHAGMCPKVPGRGAMCTRLLLLGPCEVAGERTPDPPSTKGRHGNRTSTRSRDGPGDDSRVAGAHRTRCRDAGPGPPRGPRRRRRSSRLVPDAFRSLGRTPASASPMRRTSSSGSRPSSGQPARCRRRRRSRTPSASPSLLPRRKRPTRTRALERLTRFASATICPGTACRRVTRGGTAPTEPATPTPPRAAADPAKDTRDRVTGMTGSEVPPDESDRRR